MNWGGGNIVLRSAAGGRDEETNSEYAEGIRVKWYPGRRQHKLPAHLIENSGDFEMGKICKCLCGKR